MTDRLYYVEKPDETLQTSDRFEAARIAAEWIRRGYPVDVAVIEAGEQSVEETDRHRRVVSGTGGTGERRELEALCRGLRATA